MLQVVVIDGADVHHAAVVIGETMWVGGGRLSICHQAVGQRALMAYRPGAGQTGNLMWLDVQDDLPSRPGVLAGVAGVAPASARTSQP